MDNENKILSFSDNSKATFLLGAYREEKSQLDWILGICPERLEKLYNVRHNADLFANRDGGYLADEKPDYVILYDYHSLSGIKVFECLNVQELNEQAMATLEYPEPNGSYFVYELGSELCAQTLDLNQLFTQYKQFHPEYKEAEPLLFSGEQLIEFAIINKYTKTTEMKLSRPEYKTIDLFAGIGGIRRGFDNAFGKDIETVFVSEWMSLLKRHIKLTLMIALILQAILL